MSYKEYTVRVYDIGTKHWLLNGNLHREDGPAIEYASGTKLWYLNGKCHREDGPAIEYSGGGRPRWILNGIEYTEAEFKAKMAPAKEMTVAEIEALLGYRLKIVKDNA